MKSAFTQPPVIGFAAFSGSGKTTLLESLIPLLAERGVRTGVIKHSHHDFEIDRPGKDSYRLRKAGAQQLLLASPYRTAWIGEQPTPREPDLEQLLSKMDRSGLDLILVEGFRHVPFPKIEIHRASTGKPFLYRDDRSIIAIASDRRLDGPLPQLGLNRPQEIVEFILDHIASLANGALV